MRVGTFKNLKPVRPIYINPEIWGGLGIDKKSAYDPETNIRAAAKLIGRAWDRLVDPTIAKLATLYQGLGKDKVSDYGAYGQRVYDERPWEKDFFEDVRRSGCRGR